MTGTVSSYTAAVSSIYSGSGSSVSSSAVRACTWYFRLWLFACAVGVGHVDAMPRVEFGIMGVRGVDGMLNTGPVGSIGGPAVNQIG